MVRQQSCSQESSIYCQRPCLHLAQHHCCFHSSAVASHILNVCVTPQMESTMSIQALKPRMDELKAKYIERMPLMH